MRVVVADATPLHYLILIDAAVVLSRLFEKIYVPTEVRNELICEGAPVSVRKWMERPPTWLEILITPVAAFEDSSLAALDSGERAAIPRGISSRRALVDRRPGWRNAGPAARFGGNRHAGSIGSGFPGGPTSFAGRFHTTTEKQFPLSAVSDGGVTRGRENP